MTAGLKILETAVSTERSVTTGRVILIFINTAVRTWNLPAVLLLCESDEVENFRAVWRDSYTYYYYYYYFLTQDIYKYCPKQTMSLEYICCSYFALTIYGVRKAVSHQKYLYFYKSTFRSVYAVSSVAFFLFVVRRFHAFTICHSVIFRIIFRLFHLPLLWLVSR